MIGVLVRGVTEKVKELEDIDNKQVPFALAYSLTLTAKDAQTAIQKGVLPIHFTLRRRSWMEKGIRIQAATKTVPQAVVEDIHDFMYLQEVGGQKVPHYGKYIAIPLKPARTNARAVIRPENLPGAVMQSGTGFIRGNIIYRRWSKYKRAKSISVVRGPGAMMAKTVRYKIVPMYALVSRAQIKPRYEFLPATRKVVDQKWGANWTRAFERALSTKAQSELRD